MTMHGMSGLTSRIAPGINVGQDGGQAIGNPLQLPGLLAWYDPSKMPLANNDPVAAFTDFSGNGRTPTAAGAARPTFLTGQFIGQSGSLPGVSFTTDDAMSVAFGQAVRALFCVVKPTSAISAGSARMGLTGAETGVFKEIAWGPVTALLTNEIITVLDDNAARTAYTHASATISAAAHVMSFVFRGGGWSIRVDGVDIANAVIGVPSPFSPGELWLGAENGGVSGFLEAVLGEMHLHGSSPSTLQVIAAERRLGKLWGVTIP